MDRYDRILADIRERTDNGSLEWVVARPESIAQYILNPDRIIHCYQADYTLGSNQYQLVFVETRHERFDHFGNPYNVGDVMVLVLDSDGMVALTLNDLVVNRDELLLLGGSLSEVNDRAKQFFEAFDAAVG